MTDGPWLRSNNVYHAIPILDRRAILGIAEAEPGLPIAEFIQKALVAGSRDGPGCGCSVCLRARADAEEFSGLRPAVEHGWLCISATGHVYRTKKDLK